MKKLINLHIMALALAFTVLAGTSVFAADPSNALNGDSDLLSTSDFKVLSGLSANPMNEAELDGVQGKAFCPPCYELPRLIEKHPPFPPICHCPHWNRNRLKDLVIPSTPAGSFK